MLYVDVLVISLLLWVLGAASVRGGLFFMDCFQFLLLTAGDFRFVYDIRAFDRGSWSLGSLMHREP